ncbi:hypothetical protein D5R38_18625 [Serratia marcescens]|uniref:hypothetical protein n=1 Tax=Serratia marcescens TaxID=615 RepID=UPI00106774B7|nr:hypothetical protein [Serratia marcescens]TEW83386.1 hypothetical protein D5R38_18625 [Serratia marcescens]
MQYTSSILIENPQENVKFQIKLKAGQYLFGDSFQWNNKFVKEHFADKTPPFYEIQELTVDGNKVIFTNDYGYQQKDPDYSVIGINVNDDSVVEYTIKSTGSNQIYGIPCEYFVVANSVEIDSIIKVKEQS